MKKNFSPKFPFNLLLYSGLSFLLLSCNDDDDDTIVIEIPSLQDAQEVVAISLAYDSYGLTAHFEEMSQTINEANECGVLNENNDSGSGDWDSDSITYTYSINEEFTKFCDPALLIEYSSTAAQELDAPRFSGTHTINTEFTVTGLEEEVENEEYTGFYNKVGIYESGNDEQFYEFSYKSDLSNILVSKELGKIISGNVIFTLEQEYDYNDLTYTYMGSVEFLNENEARVEFETGEEFIVDLNNVSISN